MSLLQASRADGSMRLRAITFLLMALAILPALASTPKPPRVVQSITLADGRSFVLSLPRGLQISPAVQGLKRVRFFARSPDGRVFVTDMHDLGDNSRGAVYILDGWDEARGTYARVIPYLTGLRNPNNLAFYTDPNGQQWLYVALTDHLLRYRYAAGDIAPGAAPEIIATFPDYGLSYKYGGWHLTRTVVVGDNGKLYVAVGSSCNACIETEAVRASVLEVNPDGSAQRIYSRGLRNAVGMGYARGRLMVTNQGADHLGINRPNETFHVLREGADYGWPHCYQEGAKIVADPKFPRRVGCRGTPQALAVFPAHASALGFAYFPASAADTPATDRQPLLDDTTLVALHGSTNARIGHGYKVVRVDASGRVSDVITGFLKGRTVNGRPCDIFQLGPDRFLLSDDHRGVIYLVRPAR